MLTSILEKLNRDAISSPSNEEVLERYIIQSMTNTHTKNTNMKTSKLID